MGFETLGLQKDLVALLSSLKLTTPTDAQKEIIPLLLNKKNVVFTSRTGSGKTLCYTLPFVSKMSKKGLQMLVLVPTRELCIQVGKEMRSVCEPLNIKVGMLYGGREIDGDKRTTSRNNHIIVGTPGRLVQHINQKNIKVGDVSVLVFDESDQMFDQGFAKECSYVCSRVSKNAQLVLASATLSDKVMDFADDIIQEYELCEIGDAVPKNIVQETIHCTLKERAKKLEQYLSENTFSRTIIFCNTKARSHELAKIIGAKEITSNLDQNERVQTLNLFKQGKIKVLVATDVVARGIHVENVDLVVNFDVAKRAEFHIHRMGRTGRKDTKGHVLTFVCKEDEEQFLEITKHYNLETTEYEFRTSS